MIIAAFAGTGKTTLAAMHPDTTIDFVCMPYKYYLEQNGSGSESGKANPDNTMREEWPYNYVEAIKTILGYGKTILIPSDRRVLSHLRLVNIPYTLCYPQRSAKDAYRQRFIDRGNTEDFLSVFIDGWDWFMDALEGTEAERRIVLEPHQYLNDVIWLLDTPKNPAYNSHVE